MRKVILPLASLTASSLLACSFSLRAGGGNDPQSPANNQQATAPPTQPQARTTTAPPAASTPSPVKPIRSLGKRPAPTPTSTSTVPPPAPTTPPAPPSGAPVVSGSTIFGSGTVDATGFKGSIYWVPAGTTKLPDLATMQPNGLLFTKELNIAPQAFTGGFPGIDTSHVENFAIRYEAPLVVKAEADYDFRLVADDGAILRIDGTPIVDNDGARDAPAEKTGPVHLVAGTHLITVDYLQTTRNVALQVFCKKAGEAEKICPTQL
jgi:hypothetical protein